MGQREANRSLTAPQSAHAQSQIFALVPGTMPVERGLVRVGEVLETSHPQVPVGLGSATASQLPGASAPVKSSLQPLKGQRAGLVPWGRPPWPLPPTAACNHHVDSWLTLSPPPSTLHPLQAPRTLPPYPEPGADLDNFTDLGVFLSSHIAPPVAHSGV